MRINIEEFMEKYEDEISFHYSGIIDFVVYAGNHEVDFGSMQLYRKLPVPLGFALSTDVFSSGTKITIRMLEGDIDTITDDDIYLMIGVLGEVYPIRKERFDADYRIIHDTYSRQHEYAPAIINRITGQRHEITHFAKLCIPIDKKLVRATKLSKSTKVFTEWDTEKYYSGAPGDWLVANEGDYSDCYIVRRDVFEMSYVQLKKGRKRDISLKL